MKEKNSKQNTTLMVMTAMMICLIVIMTAVIRIPVPATQGYIHLGDCMIFFGVLLLGWKGGTLAAGTGSALADVFAGYAQFAPISFVAKCAMALIMGLFIEYSIRREYTGTHKKVIEIMGMVLGGAVMIVTYYFAEGFMYGNFIVPLIEIPMNLLQFAIGILIATSLAHSLSKTSMNSKFAYHFFA